MKPELLERLLNESECTYLDFKQAQYPFGGATPDEVKSELLKDILALTNADKTGDGYILIGVDEARGSRAKVLGITTHLNDHDLQQFVASKTNRPIKFAYEAVPCDGVSIGVLHVSAQERPVFLKNDYGKLRRNVVYYRLGSSTREATPEELVRWGQQSASKDAEPCLELQFAQIKRPTTVGGSNFTKEVGTSLCGHTRNTSPVPGAELANLCPTPNQRGFTREAEYWMDFAKFLRFGLLFIPVGLALKNIGGATANDVRVKLTPTSQSKLIILGDEGLPGRPLHTSKFGGDGMTMFASHTKFAQKDIAVQEEAGQFSVAWSIPKALPHLLVFSEGMFYVGASESGQFEFQCSIFAENLRRPTQTTLSVTIERESKDLTREEIQKFSDAFTFEDVRSGIGRFSF